MKQLKKLQLKDFSEMNDAEMKNVVGGSGVVIDNTSCGDSAPTCNGSCAARFEYSKGKLITIQQKCEKNTITSLIGSGNLVSLVICQCVDK